MTIKESANMIMGTCMGAKPGESVLIITDTNTDERIAKALFDAAAEKGCEALILTMIPRSQDGQEPPEVVADAMKKADVILVPTSKSLTHTKARKEACEIGARAATLPGITLDMMTAGGLTADYDLIASRARQMLEKLAGSKEVHITTQLGTDLIFDVDGCEWMADTGRCTEPGSFSNLPAGELFVAPANVNGTMVIDGAMGGIGLLEEPIRIEIKDRKAVDFSAGLASELEEMVDAVGPLGRNIAELGIGINPAAQLIGVVLEDEKVGGTVHVALGDNSTFGGDVSVDLHLDGIITSPKVHVDGQELDIKSLAENDKQ